MGYFHWIKFALKTLWEDVKSGEEGAIAYSQDGTHTFLDNGLSDSSLGVPVESESL